MGTMTTIGSASGYLAKPSGMGPWPAVIVIQEWWGLDQQTKSIADRLAGLSYLAFAPDLYHGELAQLGNGETAMKLVQKYGGSAAGELQALFDALKQYPDSNGKIGSIGFCFGGRMSLALGISRPREYRVLLRWADVVSLGHQPPVERHLHLLWRWDAAIIRSTGQPQMSGARTVRR